MKHQLAVLLLVIFLPGMVITNFVGCAGKGVLKDKEKAKELVIPDFPVAREQFRFAKMYQDSQILRPELDRRRIQMNEVSQYYQRVLVNFPNDATYVPLTLLELGDCAAQSDNFESALSFYQQAMSKSQDEFIQVRSKYSIARIYDTTGRYVEAKQIYKGIMEDYVKSESGRVRDVVQRSAKLYMQVHEVKK